MIIIISYYLIPRPSFRSSSFYEKRFFWRRRRRKYFLRKKYILFSDAGARENAWYIYVYIYIYIYHHFLLLLACPAGRPEIPPIQGWDTEPSKNLVKPSNNLIMNLVFHFSKTLVFPPNLVFSGIHGSIISLGFMLIPWFLQCREWWKSLEPRKPSK